MVEFLEEVAWEMAAASLRNRVLLDSEERHERAFHCACAYDDSLVGSLAGARRLLRNGNTKIQVSGMPRMDATEELNALCGRHAAGVGKFQLSCRRKKDQGAVTSVLDLVKAFERVSFLVVWAWTTHFKFARKILRVPCGYFFEHQRSAQFEGCVAEPLQTITAFFPGSEWTCFVLRVVCQDVLRQVTNINPPLKFEGVCG